MAEKGKDMWPVHELQEASAGKKTKQRPRGLVTTHKAKWRDEGGVLHRPGRCMINGSVECSRYAMSGLYMLGRDEGNPKIGHFLLFSRKFPEVLEGEVSATEQCQHSSPLNALPQNHL